jgi:hypothetical protein
MTRRQPICAVIALLLLPSWGWAADGQQSEPGSQASGAQAPGSTQPTTDSEPVFDLHSERYLQDDVRFGWWAMWHTGSPAKVGEYQSLEPSPFWDVDSIFSNGTNTLDFTATGTDQDTTTGRLYYYRPGLSAKVDYERFLHRLDHDPLSNIAPTSDSQASPAATNPKFIQQDLGAGQDYAVRVQELKASFKGDICSNVKARLDVWGMQKDGTRQVNAVGMCYTQNATVPPDHPPVNTFTGSRCHVLSQPQQICWTTTEIKPVIEARLTDLITLEYSRPMRGFTAGDSTTTRFYNGTGKISYPGASTEPYAYGVVPDSYTQMDQLKLSGRVSEDNKVYAFLMIGNTVNEEISMNRAFNDLDVRWTNTSIENVSLTTYGGFFNEDEENPSITRLMQLNPESSPSTLSQAIREPIDYHRSTAGVRSTWRPWGGGYAHGGLAIVSGYEYCDLDRTNAIYTLATSTQPNVPAGSVLDQSHTITNSFQIGPTYRWSPAFDIYAHYKYQNAAFPLLGLNSSSTTGLDNGVINTRLPEHDNIIELGFNWFPSDCFMFNVCLGYERGDTHSKYADFDEENYPMNFNAWYAVNTRWSLSAGYAVYSNFIGQDITVADQTPYTGTPTAAAAPITSRWNYGGQAHVVTIGSRYALTECVILTGDVEWVRGHDLIYNSAITGVALTPALGTYSEVLNETTRIRVGADWKFRPRMVIYGRYELYDFNDEAPGYQTGLAQGVLGGFSALF